jgi:hypothetical protein
MGKVAKDGGTARSGTKLSSQARTRPLLEKIQLRMNL